MSANLDWIEAGRDVKKVGNISYSEATYTAKVTGGILYRVDWFVTDTEGRYLDGGKSLTFAPKSNSKIREIPV